MTDDFPKYMSAAEIRGTLGLSYRRLRDLWRRGFIRSIKFDKTQQATRLYRTDDVVDSLDRLSTGYEPKKQKIQTEGERK